MTSWNPNLFIGELRPWPESVRVVRGRTDEARMYAPERTREGGGAMSEKHLPYVGGAFDRVVFDGDGTVWVRECRLESMDGYTDPFVPTRYTVVLSCHTLDDWPESEPPAYCPWCGAKVVLP